MSVDDLRAQLRDRGYLLYGIERWFALDPWRSRAFWVELTIVSAKAAVLIGAFAMLPLVAIMLFRNHPLSAWETLLMAIMYGGAALVASFAVLIVVALILKLRPALAIDTPRALLAISFGASAILTLAIVLMPKMNLYLVLALALGAATPAPVAPPTAHVVTRSERAVVCAVEHRLQPVRMAWLKPGLHRASLVVLVVLTGAASPRAPAAL